MIDLPPFTCAAPLPEINFSAGNWLGYFPAGVAGGFAIMWTHK